MKKSEKKKSNNIKWLIIAVLLIITIALPLFFIGGEDYPIKEIVIKSENTLESTETAYVPRWDEMEIYQQFSSYNGYYCTAAMIPKGQIGDMVESTTLSGYDEYEPETVHEINAEVYEINGINPECALAVKYEGDIVYYSFTNSSYRPETLGQFTNDLNLINNISFGTVYYSYFDKNEYVTVEFDGITVTEVWKLLITNNLNAKNIHDDNMMLIDAMSISTNVELLGYNNISLAVTEDGYLTTNILSTGKTFFIGKDATDAFMSYVKENLDGYKIVYVYEEKPNDDTEEVSSVSSIVQYNVETGEETVIEIDPGNTDSSETEASTESYDPSN